MQAAHHFMPDGAGGAQGNQMADKNETAVSVRSSGVGTDPLLFQQANSLARFRQIVGAGQSDDTPADYKNIAVFFHWYIQAEPGLAGLAFALQQAAVPEHDRLGNREPEATAVGAAGNHRGKNGILQVRGYARTVVFHVQLQHQAVAIAESYLEEVLLHAYSDPDGTSGESLRRLFDDVDDYDGLTDAGDVGEEAGETIGAPVGSRTGADGDKLRPGWSRSEDRGDE